MYTVNIYYGHWSDLRQFAFIKGNDKYSLIHYKKMKRCNYFKLHKNRYK